MVDLVQQGYDELNKECKTALIGAVLADVKQADKKGPLMAALHRTATGLMRCYAGTERKLTYPELK